MANKYTYNHNNHFESILHEYRIEGEQAKVLKEQFNKVQKSFEKLLDDDDEIVDNYGNFIYRRNFPSNIDILHRLLKINGYDKLFDKENNYYSLRLDSIRMEKNYDNIWDKIEKEVFSKDKIKHDDIVNDEDDEDLNNINPDINTDINKEESSPYGITVSLPVDSKYVFVKERKYELAEPIQLESYNSPEITADDLGFFRNNANHFMGATGPSNPYANFRGNLGATGPTGPTGPRGCTGPVGCTGPTGPRGYDGIRAPTGTFGASLQSENKNKTCGFDTPSGCLGPTGFGISINEASVCIKCKEAFPDDIYSSANKAYMDVVEYTNNNVQSYEASNVPNSDLDNIKVVHKDVNGKEFHILNPLTWFSYSTSYEDPKK